MDANSTTLTPEEVTTIRLVLRAGRVLAVLMLAAAVPLLLPVVAPALGVALLTVVLLSPVLVSAVLVLAARQTDAERRGRAA